MMNNDGELARLQQEIRLHYDSLSKQLKQVANYLLDNPNTIMFDTITDIAKKADVPPSTLIRFANALGFSGFSEIKKIFKNGVIENTPDYTKRLQITKRLENNEPRQVGDILSIFSQANSQALNQLSKQMNKNDLKQAVNILQNAKTIFIVGLKRSFSIACYLNYALYHLDCRSFILNGIGGMLEEQLGQIKDGDVVVAISFSPYARETVDVMQETAQKGIKHIAITDSPMSPLVNFSDVAFVVKEAQIKGFRSQCATMTLVQTLAIALGIEKERETVIV